MPLEPQAANTVTWEVTPLEEACLCHRRVLLSSFLPPLTD